MVHPSTPAAELPGVTTAVGGAVAAGGDQSFVTAATGSLRTWCWDTELDDVLRSEAPSVSAGPSLDVIRAPEDPAVIAFTSGTSGRPKGVVLTHENLWWQSRHAIETLGISHEDRALVATPVAHIAGFAGLAQHAWSVGGSVVLAPRFDPGPFIQLVLDHEITMAFAVPAMLARLLQHPDCSALKASSLRWLLTGGGPAVAHLTLAAAAAGITVLNSYGLTEAGGGVTYAKAEEVADHPLSAGRPAGSTEVRIVDLDGVAVGTGVAGQICLRGPAVSRQQVTADGRGLPALDDTGWLVTGDMGMLDDQGRLYVNGRIGDTIITGGENVDPAEVEGALCDLEGVREVAVIGPPADEWGQVVTAVLVLDDGANVGLEEVRQHLRLRLARYKIPRDVVHVQHLPRTGTGKLLRRELLAAILAPKGED
jgi:fatty-acyl-CoA synthase